MGEFAIASDYVLFRKGERSRISTALLHSLPPVFFLQVFANVDLMQELFVGGKREGGRREEGANENKRDSLRSHVRGKGSGAKQRFWGSSPGKKEMTKFLAKNGGPFDSPFFAPAPPEGH